VNEKKSVLLIAFYNGKALGVRYLAKALKKKGYDVNIVYYKGFHSSKPSKTTAKELELLMELIKKTNPLFIGLSVMASLYLETVWEVNKKIRENFDGPVMWGGVYPTLFPAESLKYCDYVIRGEGEQAIVELADAFSSGSSVLDIPNLAYIKDGQFIQNGVRPLEQDLDTYGYPDIGGKGHYFIHNDSLEERDPQLDSYSYELTASRGCPFTCSYCSAINLHRVYIGQGKYVRFRSVESVMDELNEAKRKIKKLKMVHFWDEIFSDDEGWVDEFARRYKEEIDLPFEIWGHPLKVDEDVIRKLVEAGLYKIVVGIQSGSPRIRREIFNRPETQEQIIETSRVLARCKVPQVIYDFMLQHPFETEEDIRQSYELCTQLARPFELQLHGLNFLPGTDIVQKAIDLGIYTEEEMDKIINRPMQEQFDSHWGGRTGKDAQKSAFWFALIYLNQFPLMKGLTASLAKNHNSPTHVDRALKLYKLLKPAARFRELSRKALLVMGIR
jgi:anaerobic magnesium-protoporphyrin IX monomethyl ester cyclase